MSGPREVAGGKVVLDHPAEAVARLTLSNPGKRNALDHETLNALLEAFSELDRGIEVRCVVLRGTEGVFSAGYDIGAIPQESFERDAEALVAHPFHRALEAISAHPYPTIAAINGHCLGGGLELALCCDLRLASRDARLGMPPAKLGLIYSHTGLARFVEAVGAPRTRELFLTGRQVGGERAEQIGLVHEALPAADVDGAALELATDVAGNAPISMRGNKHAIGEVASAAHRLTPEQERELIELRRSCFASEDFKEGVRAFAEKRTPRWTGR